MLGDCLERMKEIPDGSVDMILCDLPYGTTACKWDVVIPFEPMWEQYWRVLKKNNSVCLFAKNPFASTLLLSNIKNFRYQWYWKKNKSCEFVHAKNRPLDYIEQILVFSTSKYGHASQLKESRMNFYPQGVCPGSVTLKDRKHQNSKSELAYARPSHQDVYTYQGENYPKTLLEFGNPKKSDRCHPTQKPVPLLEYLIKTYTNEGETVLDNCMGSGSTGVACINTGRKFIGIEKDEKYFEVATRRLAEASNLRETPHSA
jgi:site-specific DNA-methyltransferase (adenine-specific)